MKLGVAGIAVLAVAGLMATLALAAGQPAEEAAGAQDVADVRSQNLRAGGDPNKRYFLIEPKQEAAAPKDGYSVLLVLPGGGGGEDFHPFVKRVFKHALSADYLVAQLVAAKWTPGQQIVWPTRKNPVPKQEFATEDFIKAVVDDVGGKQKLNKRRIFTLSWSSGGPAAYAASLEEGTPITGSFIAMSVFNPEMLPSLQAAKGHAYLLYHSRDDRVCPFAMARQAEIALRQNGAAVELATYEGGHGWRGDVYGDIRRGIAWLENPGEPKAETTQVQGPVTTAALPITDGFETGQRAPEGWQQGTAVPGVQYIWDKNTAFEGKASLCLKKTAQRFFPIADWSRVVRHEGTGRMLTVSAQVKAEQAAKAVIDVLFLDAQGNWIKHEWAAYIGAKEAGDPPANHDWKEYAGTVEIPPGTKLVRLGLQIYGPGTVWFDALTAGYAKP
jgi:predicted esterase